ncbi:MAG: hypothetical protein KDB00_09555 [Planctomycetales bacterium]|nr:hypothetical protein [Planctomycetales bacterium]
MDQKLLKFATIALLVGVVAFLGWHAFKNSQESDASTIDVASKPSDPDAAAKRAALDNVQLGTFGHSGESTEESQRSDGSSNFQRDALTLRVGVIGATPSRDEVTAIMQFPHDRTDVRRAYAEARDRACRLLVPGVAVSPPLTKLLLNQAGTLGRTTVLAIGLEYDSTGPKKLPAVTRGQVVKYFEKHRLAVQPMIYHDANGRPYFGTDCQAAFYELARPGLTVNAEAMIAVAVGRFRALGIVGGAATEGTSGDILGRTLALAFTFAQKDETITGASDAALTVTELLLLHLSPDCTADDPEIQVFVTSDQRSNLHRLETRGLRLNSPTPTISADIQFNKTVLMGMYPADPVVSGIRYRSSGILSMDTIKRLGKADGQRPAVSLTEILDQFGKLADSGSSI